MNRPGRDMFRAIMLALFAATVSHAQEPQKSDETHELTQARSETWPNRDKVWPEHWYKDWEWWAGEAVLVGERFGDTYTTVNRCKGCLETNPLLGKNPTSARVITLSMVGAGVLTTMHIVSWKACPDVNRRSRVWRFACNAWVPGISSALSIPTILHNNHLNNRATQSSISPASVGGRQSAAPQQGSLIRTNVPRTNQVLISPKAYEGCLSRLTSCYSPTVGDSPKVDLSNVQLVRNNASQPQN